MREAERATGRPGAPLLRLSRDVILLLKDLVTDPRVPRQDKALAGLAAVYLMSPIDLLPDRIPVIGQLDDLGITAVALRRLLSAAGYEVIYELWRGTNEGLALVLTLGGVEE